MNGPDTATPAALRLFLDNYGWVLIASCLLLFATKTLFNAPGTATSSEIPQDEQIAMGLTDGLIRFSIGLDNDIERTYQHMKECMEEIGI